MAGITAVYTAPDGATHEALLPGQYETRQQLLQAAQQAFGQVSSGAVGSGDGRAVAPCVPGPRQETLPAVTLQEVTLSDGQQDITSDAHVQQLVPGQRVLVRSAQAQEGAVFQVWPCLDSCRRCAWGTALAGRQTPQHKRHRPTAELQPSHLACQP